MAVPTIISISPTSGHASGRTLVKVVGTNFKLLSAAPATGLAPDAPPSMAVLVGGRAGDDVEVLSSTLLQFLTPSGSELEPPAGVAVVVQNLDDDGVPIVGEQASLAAAFTYLRTQLGKTNDSDFTRLVRSLIRELKKQVIPNVALTVESDWDSKTGDALSYVNVASFPALVLIGPRLRKTTGPYKRNERTQTAKGSGEWVTRRGASTKDIVFVVVGITDNVDEALNFMSTVQAFFDKNVHLRVPRSTGDTSEVAYDMLLSEGGDLAMGGGPNNSNVRQFSGEFEIRGFDFEDQPGLVDEAVVERSWEVDATGVRLEHEQTGASFGPGPGPGEG